MIAWDRRSLARRVHRLAANGAVVLCDRYPSPQVGAMDSARLSPDAARGALRRRAAAWEQALYRQIPRPTLVVQLSVPVDVAVRRNRDRVKDGKESDDYVIHRHTHQEVPCFPGVPTVQLDTGEDRAVVIRRLREAVWRHL
jgi:thymidylate kinase